MTSIKSCILLAFLLLICNELVMRINCVSADNENSSIRLKRSLTTICVEIKPNGPLEEPYYMCRGTEFPGFQKTQPQQHSNIAGNNQPGSKQITPSYVKNDEYRSPYNFRDDADHNVNLASHYDSTSGDEKNNNGLTETVTSYPQFYNGNTGGGSDSGSDGFQKQAPSISFHKPSGQYQQFHDTDLNQRFQPQSQPQRQSPPSQQRPFHYQKQQPIQPTTSFHQASKNFRSSIENESSVPVPNDSTNYDGISFQGANRQMFFRAHSDGYPGDLSSRSFLKNYATNPSYGSTVLETPQHKADVTGCGDDCSKSTNTAAASANFDDRHSGKPVFHNGPNSPIQKSNADTIPAGYDKVSPSFTSDPYAFSIVARTQHQPASHFRAPTTFDEYEAPILSSVSANLPNSLNIRLRPLTHGPFGALRFDPLQRTNFMHRQLQPILPAAHRYRAMIDDEVLQVPNWGFSTDELDFYRATPDVEQDILSLPPTPRTIPIEHLEDPVMRSFYSSLPDVGPLPVYKPANTVVYNYAQPPKQQQPTTAPQNSQKTNPTCTPCQGYSQNSNYNSCTPLGGCNFQPVFVALPCYNPSVFQSMMPQLQIAPLNTNDYKQFRMINPSTTSTTMPIYHTETRPSKNPNIYQDIRSESVATTLTTTAANDSLESVDSLEEILPPKEIPTSKASNSNFSEEKDSSSKETQKAVVEKPNGSNSNINETTQSPTTEFVSASYSVTTPSSAEMGDDLNTAAQSRTTFKSLFLTAKKLAQLNTNSEEFNQYAQDISTPRSSPKRQRQASRLMVTGNGHGRRKFMQQM